MHNERHNYREADHPRSGWNEHGSREHLCISATGYIRSSYFLHKGWCRNARLGTIGQKKSTTMVMVFVAPRTGPHLVHPRPEGLVFLFSGAGQG